MRMFILMIRLFMLQSVRQVTLDTAAVRPVHTVSTVGNHAIISQDNVNVCLASKEHCAMRVRMVYVGTQYHITQNSFSIPYLTIPIYL